MPSTKRKSTYDASDPFVASDSASPPPPKTSKRAKPTSTTATPSFTPASSLSTPQQQTDSDGNAFWALSAARRVTVSEFKGKKMVSVREYYEKDGAWLPGKKGITMTLEQFGGLVRVLPQIERVLGKEGRDVGRPRYGDDGNGVGMSDGKEDDEGEDDVGDEGGRAAREMERKANIEATSDEDEE